MSGHSRFSGTRRIQRIGNSLGITLDKEGLEEMGHNPDDLEGEDIHAELDADSGRLVAELPDP